MAFLGLISFFDPPKDSAKHAIYQLAERGISPKILTGDSLSLTIKVCEEVGIATNDSATGADLDALDEMEFHETVNRATILARLTPTQKLQVVQSLQKHGNHIVGYVGDGINDSLALNAANVGISVDSGASIAKKCADIILLEKDLNVLAFGVEHGRLTYGNTMKYIKLSLVANFSSMMSLLVVTIFTKFEPLSPRQLLIQNFIYSMGQIAIPWDKMEDGYARTPQIWSWKELPVFMLWNGPVCSIFDISMFMFVRLYYGAHNVAMSFFNTAWFVESLMMQALIIHMIRTAKMPFVLDVSSWPVLVSTLAVSAIAVVTPYTLLGQIMGLTQLPFSYFGFLVVLFLGYFSVGQVVKRIYIKVFGRWL
jgi:P-type Mg2+ transporter